VRCLRNSLDSRVVVLTSCLLLLATASGAQVGYCGTFHLYCDSLYTCTKTKDTEPRILKVYVVHDDEGHEGGFTASQFMVGASDGFTGTWVADSTPYPYVRGSSPVGIVIGYGNCVPSGLVLTITYMLSGTSASDSYLQALPDPTLVSGKIELALCVGMSCYCNGAQLTINSSVPIGSTTWGLIKGLYSESPSNTRMQPTTGAQRER
jgi:hypothetical protein